MLPYYFLITSLPVILGNYGGNSIKERVIKISDVDLDDDLFLPMNDRHFYVMNGCTEPGRPESVVSMREDSKHYVRCCTNSGDLCVSRIRHANDTRNTDDLHCQYLPQTYKNAERICRRHGLRLCTIEMKRVVPKYPTREQNQLKPGKELCCTTGCNHDLRTMWTSIRDPCIPNPCQNGGICSDTFFTGNYSCICSPDWTGSDCSRYNPPPPPPPPPQELPNTVRSCDDEICHETPATTSSNSRLIDTPQHFKYNCGLKSCFYTSQDASVEEKVGYYSKTIGDCNKCEHMCDMDANCGGVECGQDYCIWWKIGECTSEEERRDQNWRYITCMKTDEPELPSAPNTDDPEHLIASSCSNTVNEKAHEIASPNYPNQYENNQYCRWSK